MKTKLQISSLALLGLLFASCSSSMYMSKSSASSTDDIYYTPNKTTSSLTNSENNQTSNSLSQEPEKLSIAQLEEKYSKVLSSDSSIVDTLIYKANSSNPYDRILSDTYQDSYERRLRAYEPYNRMNDYGIYDSKNYWYASTFDPLYYNIVVAGGQVWVEPWSITTMFTTRVPWNYWLGYNFGWRVWCDNYYYSPYYCNSSLNGGIPYWGGYPYYWNDNNTINNYSYYGRRTIDPTNSTSLNRRTETSYENQIVSSRRRNETTYEAGVNRNNDIRSRNTLQTNSYNRIGERNNNQEVTSRSNRTENINTTRLRGEATTRNINSTEPTRRNNNNSYQRPRSTNNDGYIRTGTRNQNNGSVSQDNTRGNSTTRDNRNATPTYNRPNRVDSSTDRARTTTSGSTNRESTNRGSGSNNSAGSYSAPRSNSGTSSSSTNNSGSQQSNTGSGTRRR